MSTFTYSISEYYPKATFTERFMQFPFLTKQRGKILRILIIENVTTQYFFYCKLNEYGLPVLKDVSNFEIHQILNRNGDWVYHNNPQELIPEEIAQKLKEEYCAIANARFRVQNLIQSHVPRLA